MGFFEKLSQKLPKSPVSVAKTVLKIYRDYKKTHPNDDNRKTLNFALKARYHIKGRQ